MTSHYHRIIKGLAIVALIIMAALAVVALAFFWRLSQGAVSLDFMRPKIESEINKSLSGLTVKVGAAVLELDNKTYVPHFRLHDVVMRDSAGDLIARADRAAISFEMMPLLHGNVVPHGLELIGTRILVNRSSDGTISLGFGNFEQASANLPSSASADQSLPPEMESNTSAKGDVGSMEMQQSVTAPPTTGLKEIIDQLGKGSQQVTASTIETISISKASIEMFDEVNQSRWFAPEANLTFTRTLSGFDVQAMVRIESGPASWLADIAASYRVSDKDFLVKIKAQDVVPAYLAQKVFALNQFAKVDVPLSGHAELEIKEDGTLLNGTAELTAAAGVIELPDYFAEPLNIDEGSLHASYDPASGGIAITDSVLLVGGSRAAVVGTLTPLRSSEGQITDVEIVLKANNVSVDTQGTVVNPVLVDRVEFTGRAAVAAPLLTIDDLIIMSGTAGVRVRGTLQGGEGSPGIILSGLVREVSVEFIQQLWPPKIGKRAKQWIANNVKSGRINEGTFQVNIPPGGLDLAIAQKQIPNESVDFQFTLSDITSAYFKNLPDLIQASGKGHLMGNSFRLDLTNGSVMLPSGTKVQARTLVYSAENLMKEPVIAHFDLDIASSLSGLMEYASLPDLNLLQSMKLSLPPINGDATAHVTMSLPLKPTVTREEIITTTSVVVSNASAKQVAPNIDMSDGKFNLVMNPQGVSLKGDMKLNGYATNLSWSRPGGTADKGSATISTTIDDAMREKLGLGLGDVLRGPVRVSANLSSLDMNNASVAVEADLSKASLQIAAMDWRRPPTANTTASFTVQSNGDKGRQIKNLVVKGPSLSIEGDISLTAKNTFVSANFSQVWLSDMNNFAVSIQTQDKGQVVQVKGQSFDARSYLTSYLKGTSSQSDFRSDMVINLNLNQIIAHRAELVKNASGTITLRGGSLASAEINGTYLSGQKVNIRMRSNTEQRELQVTSNDGGATLRAVNIYSKVAGGELVFVLRMPYNKTRVQSGQLTIRYFEVRNEAALAELDKRGKPMKSGPRRDGIAFSKMTLPFTIDDRYIHISEAVIKGNELGAFAEGDIRKSDGAIDISGTFIPAYGLNSVLNKVPLVGQILSDGKGVFGITFAMTGSFANPKLQFNPISALAPGIIRKFFEYDGPGGPAPSRPVRNDRN